MSLQVERYKFIEAMVKEGMARHTATLIMRHATTLQRLAYIACSVECSEAETQRNERSEALAEARIKMLCSQAPGFSAVFSGDPRGACVKIKVPSGRSDSWGNDGMCVPTKNF